MHDSSRIDAFLANLLYTLSKPTNSINIYTKTFLIPIYYYYKQESLEK